MMLMTEEDKSINMAMILCRHQIKSLLQKFTLVFNEGTSNWDREKKERVLFKNKIIERNVGKSKLILRF